MPDSKTPCAGNLTVKTTLVINKEKPYNAPVKHTGKSFSSRQRMITPLRYAARLLLWFSPMLCLPGLRTHFVKQPAQERDGVSDARTIKVRVIDSCVEIDAGTVEVDSFALPLFHLIDVMKDHTEAPSFHLTYMGIIPGSTPIYSIRYFRLQKKLRYWFYDSGIEGVHPESLTITYTNVTEKAIQSAAEKASHSTYPIDDGFGYLPDFGCSRQIVHND